MAVSTSITAKSGRSFLLKASDGTSPTVFNTVGGIRNTQMTLNDNPVDITSVSSGGFREWLPDGGIQELQVSLDGIRDSLTTGASLLQQAARNRTLIECQIVSGHGDGFIFTAAVQSMQRAGAMDQAETFQFQLVSHGQVTYFAA